MTRVIVYIDGFNVYKGMESYLNNHPGKISHNKINYSTLATRLLEPGEKLQAVCWYTAIPPSNRHDPRQMEMVSRHTKYKSDLEAQGVKIRISGYKKEKRQCPHCQERIKKNKEKESDKRCSLEMLEDAFYNRVDRAILVSSDSDFVPVLYSLNRFSDEIRKIDVYICPPIGREGQAKSLLDKANDLFGTSPHRMRPSMIENSLFQTVDNPQK